MYKIFVTLLGLWLFTAGALANEANNIDVRDPTTPLGHIAPSARGSNAQAISLTSILISPQRKLAIINGATLREGQLVPGSGNIKVQRIAAQLVVLQQGDRTWSLSLSPSILKRN